MHHIFNKSPSFRDFFEKARMTSSLFFIFYYPPTSNKSKCGFSLHPPFPHMSRVIHSPQEMSQASLFFLLLLLGFPLLVEDHPLPCILPLLGVGHSPRRGAGAGGDGNHQRTADRAVGVEGMDAAFEAYVGRHFVLGLGLGWL